MWQIIPSMPPFVEVTVVTRARRSRPGLVIHETRRAPAIRTRHDLPVTAPPRTLTDLAATQPSDAVERACSEALVLQLVTEDELETAGLLTRQVGPRPQRARAQHARARHARRSPATAGQRAARPISSRLPLAAAPRDRRDRRPRRPRPPRRVRARPRPRCRPHRAGLRRTPIHLAPAARRTAARRRAPRATPRAAAKPRWRAARLAQSPSRHPAASTAGAAQAALAAAARTGGGVSRAATTTMVNARP